MHVKSTFLYLSLISLTHPSPLQCPMNTALVTGVMEVRDVFNLLSKFWHIVPSLSLPPLLHFIQLGRHFVQRGRNDLE